MTTVLVTEAADGERFEVQTTTSGPLAVIAQDAPGVDAADVSYADAFQPFIGGQVDVALDTLKSAFSYTSVQASFAPTTIPSGISNQDLTVAFDGIDITPTDWVGQLLFVGAMTEKIVPLSCVITGTNTFTVYLLSLEAGLNASAVLFTVIFTRRKIA